MMSRTMQPAVNWPHPIPFMDWHDVWPGSVRVPADYDPPCVIEDAPQGVSLRVQQARITEPFLHRENPWEYHLNYLQVLYDEGRYRLWYRTMPDVSTMARISKGSTVEFTCYAESDNGFDWIRPSLGLYEFNGSRNNNIISASGLALPHSWSLNQVFKDPTASADQRYRSIGERRAFTVDGKPLPRTFGRPEIARLRRGLQVARIRRSLRAEGLDQEDIDKRMLEHLNPREAFVRVAVKSQVLGYTSPDGVLWTQLPEPLIEVSDYLDMQNSVIYDSEQNLYISYLRGDLQRRRIVRKSVSSSFDKDWEATRNVLVPDSQDAPDVDFYSIGYHRDSMSPHHIMFLGVFHRAADSIDIHLAVSRDGDVWTRPERKPVIPRCIASGNEDSYGQMHPSPGLIPLAGNLWGQAYVALRHCHHDFRVEGGLLVRPESAGDYRWAVWQRDRLVALEAEVEGSAMIHSLYCNGRELRLNMKTERGGYIKVELLDNSTFGWELLPGFTFEDCAPLYGDSQSATVTWNGTGDLSQLKGLILGVRLRMVKARLFSIAV